MARVLNVEKIESKLRSALNSGLFGPSFMASLGKLARDRIYNKTKQGYSMATDSKLDPLSYGYVKYRQKYQYIYNTGKFFKPERSNLTFTGQMLEALTYRLEIQKKKIIIFVKDSLRFQTNKINDQKTDKALRSKNKKKSFGAFNALISRSGQRGESLTNAEVAERVSDNGRPFLALDKPAVARLRAELVRELRRVLKNSALSR
jgi:hypothetical protein